MNWKTGWRPRPLLGCLHTPFEIDFIRARMVCIWYRKSSKVISVLRDQSLLKEPSFKNTKKGPAKRETTTKKTVLPTYIPILWFAEIVGVSSPLTFEFSAHHNISYKQWFQWEIASNKPVFMDRVGNTVRRVCILNSVLLKASKSFPIQVFPKRHQTRKEIAISTKWKQEDGNHMTCGH